jgi:hypothetical protein
MTSLPRLVALLATCALVTGVAAPSAPAQQKPPPDVDELLERFPIGTDTVQTGPTTTPRAEATPPRVETPVTPPAVEVPAEDSSSSTLAAAIGALALLAAAGAAVLLVRHRRKEGPPVFYEPSTSLSPHTLAILNREWNKLQPAEPSKRRSLIVTEASKDHNQPPETKEEASAQPEHAAVGGRVSAILEAAEAAAAEIRAEARAAAEAIRSNAEAEGRSHVAQVKEEAASIRNEAEEAAKESRSAAEAYGAQQRREAEQRVQHELAQAEAQARATRQAAEEMARQIEDAAKQREEALRAQMLPLETSLRRALDAFRSISAQLEELLESEKPEDETLVEALSGSVRTAAEWEETEAPQRKG